MNGTLVPRVGVSLLDSPLCDSQSDGKQLTADWPCRMVPPGCRPRFALRPENVTAAPQYSRVKTANMQADSYLLRLVNRQVGELNAAVSNCLCRDFAECARNRLCAGNVQSTAVAGCYAKNSCVTHGSEPRGSLAIGEQAARKELQQCPWRQYTIVK